MGNKSRTLKIPVVIEDKLVEADISSLAQGIYFVRITDVNVMHS